MSLEVTCLKFLYLGVPVAIIASIWRWVYHKKPVYVYSSIEPLISQNNIEIKWHEIIPFLLRLISILALILAIARLRSPDTGSTIPVNAVDIMLVLDASGSMSYNCEIDKRTKFQVAKEEAIKFIEKRQNDSIGLVIFANAAVSRCPLTLDKSILNKIISDTEIGQINYEGTVLSKAILTAINRLKTSKAKSKIIIALTDGNPTSNDTKPEKSIKLAKKLGIKIYTIGIGSERPRHVFDQYGRYGTIPGIDVKLLKNISQKTNGRFFLTQDAEDLEEIYSEIDKLEKTEYQAPVYSNYYEYFVPLLWFVLALLVIEILLLSIVWPNLG